MEKKQSLEKKALDVFVKWHMTLKIHKASGGPAKGTISAALVVLERLKSNFNLDIEAHKAPGGSQISGVSGQAVKKILERFGETRPFAIEGGRTNRGAPGDIKKMLEALKSTDLKSVEAIKRNEILDKLQQFLVQRVAEYHIRERIKFVYEPANSTWQSIQDLLTEAHLNGKEGPVAQHLVGAKLALRFSDIKISNASYSTADDQSGRPGDFKIGDTSFHVTVAPMTGVFEKCKRNLEAGFRVYLLVPDRALNGARQNADFAASGRIAVESIESFVAQNIEELSIFSKNKLTTGLRRLLERYNERVSEVETDKSMLIEIPQNL